MTVRLQRARNRRVLVGALLLSLGPPAAAAQAIVFGPQQVIRKAGKSSEVRAVDLDGDGDAEVLAASWGLSASW